MACHNKNTVFLNETKIQRIASYDIVFVRYGKKEKYKIHCTRSNMQGSGLMVWGCISTNGPDSIIKIDDHINAKKYSEILEIVVKP